MTQKKTKDEPVEVIDDVQEAPAFEVQIVMAERPASVRAEANDTYLSIAMRFVKDGEDARELAQAIQERNGSAPVIRGTKVFLP